HGAAGKHLAWPFIGRGGALGRRRRNGAAVRREKLLGSRRDAQTNASGQRERADKVRACHGFLCSVQRAAVLGGTLRRVVTAGNAGGTAARVTWTCERGLEHVSTIRHGRKASN